MRTSSHLFADDGDVPNNARLPLIVYSGTLDVSGGDPARAFEALFAANGWGGFWRNGIFPFHHYHSTAHEVLGIAHGEADVRFGGEAGETLHVKAGDAVLIPAGVGHKRLSSDPGLLVIGAYPTGQWADLMREGAEDKAGIRKRIAAVVRPGADPVGGDDGPMRRLWK
ncbi:MAG: cupin domain-containing protein [Bauldia sp.]